MAAGTVGSFTISGVGLGTNPSVSTNDGYVGLTVVSAGDSLISGAYAINSSDPGEYATVTVTSAGYGVNGFQTNGTPGSQPPTGVQVQITPSPPMPSAMITLAGSNITGTTQTTVVGQQVELAGTVNNLPSGVTVQSRSWSAQGGPISGYNISVNSGAMTPFVDSGTYHIMFYWISPGTG